MKKQRGSVLLLASMFLVVLPAVLAVLFGLRMYYAERDEIQRTLDEASIYGQRLLPFRDLAERSVRAFLARNPKLAAHTTMSLTGGDGIEMLYQHSVPFFFAGTGEALALPLSVRAVAQRRPMDVTIYVDTSDHLAPDLFEGIPWESEADWPASSALDPRPRRDIDGDSVEVDARLATQQCFNPVFSSVKRAALTLFDYFRGFNNNAVGLGVFPAPYALGGQELLKPQFRGGDPETLATPTFLLPEYVPYNDRATDDVTCLSVSAANETALYTLPPEAREIVDVSRTCEALYQPSATNGEELTTYDPRALLWSLAIRRRLELDPGELISSFGLSVLLGQVRDRFTAGPECEKTVARNARGVFTGNPHKVGILLAGSLPYSRFEYGQAPRYFVSEDIESAAAELDTPATRIRTAVLETLVPALSRLATGRVGITDTDLGQIRTGVPILDLYFLFLCSEDPGDVVLWCASPDLDAFVSFTRELQTEANAELARISRSGSIPAQIRLTVMAAPEGTLLADVTSMISLKTNTPVLIR